MTHEEVQHLVETTVAQLGEHLDAVQLCVSWPAEGGGTHSLYRGAGNWFARRGMAQDFIERDQAQTTAHEVAQQLPQPPPREDGEEWKDES